VSGQSDFRRAFTLIELLLVVAIIALLIAILAPSLQGARKQALQLKCNANLRELGQAATFYAQDNRQHIVRAEYRPPPLGDWRSHLHYSQALLYGLPYYDGVIPGLWRPTPLAGQAPLIEVLRKIPTFQCPTFPDDLTNGDQSLDYVVNAFQMPYTDRNVQLDNPHDGGPPGQSFTGVNQLPADYEDFFKLDRLDRRTNPARVIYLTEAHHSLPTNDLQFHDVFYTSMLPLARFPRIASDKRHPRGISALFLDGHVVTMRQSYMDVGHPRPVGDRLRWFTWYVPGMQ
jgi:prepilin-type N-terminal cleavage/methylation domain-containing protein/prepilin-type processing-associated H-X9-DG protein